MMKLLLKPVQFIYCAYAVVVLVVLMLLIFPLVVMASLRGRKAGGDFVYRLCRFWTDLWMFLVGIIHTNEPAENPVKGKQYIFIANHISYLDIPLILKSIRRHPIRILGKYEMKRVPIFGFIYRSAVVMVDRSDAANRSKSVRVLKSILNAGISIFIYPEGTFNETHLPLKDFYDGAFRIAIEMQTPIKPMLFLDTHDRMHYRSVFSLNPGRSRTVFLEEVDVAGLTTDDVQTLKEKIFGQMEELLIRYKASWILKNAAV